MKGYYPFITMGDTEGEILPGVCWYDEEYKEWVIEVGGITSSYQYTQERQPLKDMEARIPMESYTEAWEQAEVKVERAYARV